jgi:putative FmdB family regulatory protein
MPNYDYKCIECECEKEVNHSISDSPQLKCDDCGGDMKKIISACHFSLRETLARNHFINEAKKDSDIRSDLQENYGIEKINPVGKNDLKSVYNDVKEQGSFVREQMQASKEKEEKRIAKKQKEWKKGAAKRAPGRSRELAERKAAQAAKDRKIIASSKKSID